MRWISDPINVLERFKINRESIADLNLSFLRKRSAEGAKYFIANLSKNFSEGMINLSKTASDVEIEDPLTGKIWKEHLNKQKQFFMSLPPRHAAIYTYYPFQLHALAYVRNLISLLVCSL